MNVEKSQLLYLKKIKNKLVKCKIKNKDRYNGCGVCFIDKTDLNRWLVRNGHAVACKYSKRYVFDEQYASQNKLGINRGTFVEPEQWRRKMIIYNV